MATKVPTLPPELPADVEVCHAIIRELASRLGIMAAELDHLKRRLFGKSSEKISSPEQLQLLFAELTAAAASLNADAQPVAAPTATQPVVQEVKKKGPARRRASRELPRERIVHDVPAMFKTCNLCEREKAKIGEDVTEQYEYTPSAIVVLEHVRPRYACSCGCQGVVQAPKPPQPIEKGSAGPGLLAHVLVSKYCDHLPLYRQEKILRRQGLDLSRSTLCGWVLEVAALLEAPVRLMRRRILQSNVVHCDESPLQVQDEAGGRLHQAWMWVYVGDPDHPYTVYDYQRSRGQAGPTSWLEGFAGGYLATDAYAAYNQPARIHQALRSGCNAHARRKFFEAKLTAPVQALHALEFYRQLYDVEARARELPPDERLRLRQTEAAPIFDRFQAWLCEQEALALPKSPLGTAIGYARTQWEPLTRYLADPRLAIDNNVAERAIRPLAIGRKNWLFAGSDNGGRATATLYSLIESARRNGVEPFEYLRDCLRRLPGMPQSDLEQLLPDRWKAAQATMAEATATAPAA